jgi:hypothetical protein
VCALSSAFLRRRRDSSAAESLSGQNVRPGCGCESDCRKTHQMDTVAGQRERHGRDGQHRCMPLVARGLGGLIDATLADFGVGSSWQSIHRMRPRVPLACAACGGAMHAKVSPRELRFFAHDAARQECPLNGETPDHRLLKSAIAAAVRAAGWQAALEAEGPDRRWRADVLATSPDGGRRVLHGDHPGGDRVAQRFAVGAGQPPVEAFELRQHRVSRCPPRRRVRLDGPDPGQPGIEVVATLPQQCHVVVGVRPVVEGEFDAAFAAYQQFLEFDLGVASVAERPDHGGAALARRTRLRHSDRTLKELRHSTARPRRIDDIVAAALHLTHVE